MNDHSPRNVLLSKEGFALKAKVCYIVEYPHRNVKEYCSRVSRRKLISFTNSKFSYKLVSVAVFWCQSQQTVFFMYIVCFVYNGKLKKESLVCLANSIKLTVRNVNIHLFSSLWLLKMCSFVVVQMADKIFKEIFFYVYLLPYFYIY